MTLSKKRKNGRNGGGGDPHRRRLSAEQFAARDRRIWQMRADGHGFQDIADAEGCGLATVDRSLKRLLTSPWEEAFGEELDAALARYNDGSMACEDVCTAEDVFKLNDLQLFRLAICLRVILGLRRGVNFTRLGGGWCRQRNGRTNGPWSGGASRVIARPDRG